MSSNYNWKDSIVYQVYPRSFNDSNGDGIGDIKGITEKLPYLKQLGVNVIWLSPVYSSPNDDNGYDISDYYNINPDFGTMDDMDSLFKESKKHGIRILMDLVVNHTSDEHEWFKEARANINSKYHDYYIWSEGDKKPNNWRAFFQGSVWEWNKETNESYLHLFSKKQPDLNWENKGLREEIYTMMRWWLDRGAGGFRLDVFNLYAKPDLYTDAPGVPDINGLVFNPGYYSDDDGMHEIMEEMNREVFSKYDCLTVGEAVNITPNKAIRYVHEDDGELNMVFHFELVSLEEKSTLNIKKVLQSWLPVMNSGGWNSNYLSNHDNPRQVSVFGDDGLYRRESATLLASMNFTLPGTPYIYQGEEIGMTNMQFDSLNQFNDIETINGIKSFRDEGMSDQFILNYFRKSSRDNSRTPVQWNNNKNAGFTKADPWLDINPNYTEINIESQINDHGSILSYYKELCLLRKERAIFIYGDCKFIGRDEENIIAYRRVYKDESMTVLLNRSNKEVSMNLDNRLLNDIKSSTLCLNNLEFLGVEEFSNGNIIHDKLLVLAPWQSLIYIK